MPRDPHCARCPLSAASTLANVCVFGHGPPRAQIMIVGEAPGAEEDRQGLPFVGQTGELLDEMLERFGIDRAQVYVTNAVKCRPPSNATPSSKQITTCADAFLREEIEQVKPRFILSLGNSALYALTKQTGITSKRGTTTQLPDGTFFFPTLHPAAILHDERNRPIITQDIRHFATVVRTGAPIKETRLNPIRVTPPHYASLLAALRGVVSVDLETSCLYPWGEHDKKGNWLTPRITAIGFGTAQGQFALFPPFADALEIIEPHLARCFIVGQHLKFDALWLKVHHGFELRQDFDTLLAHYLLDENAPHDLEYLARLYFSAPTWDIPLVDKQRGDPDVILPYLAHDLFYTRALFPVLNKQLHDDDRILTIFQHLLMPLANLFVQMEYRGVHINRAGLDDAERYLLGEIKLRERALRRWGDINWGSAVQVRKLLYEDMGLQSTLQPDADPKVMRTPKGAYSTSETALNQLTHPLVDDLKKLRGAKQEHSFFVEGWRPYIRKSRLHPSFKLHGTVTGRPSAEHPNFQQTTREPRIRSLVSAPPLLLLWEADLSQIELRLIAEASGDPVMLAIFNSGADIHFNTAVGEIARGVGYPELVLRTAHALDPRTPHIRYGDAIEIIRRGGHKRCTEIDPQWDQLRYNAKAINFGYSFGMGWSHFRVYAKNNYDLNLTQRQAQDSRRAFFDTYPRLEAWHQAVRTGVRARGFVRDLGGQRRRLPAATSYEDTPQRAAAERQAINSPIQGFAAKINLMVLLQLVEEFPPAVFRPLATVHDAILAEVRPHVVEALSARYCEIVARPPLFDVFGVELGVPLEGEVKIGSWGSGISLKKYLATLDNAKLAAYSGRHGVHP